MNPGQRGIVRGDQGYGSTAPRQSVSSQLFSHPDQTLGPLRMSGAGPVLLEAGIHDQSDRLHVESSTLPASRNHNTLEDSVVVGIVVHSVGEAA